MLRISWPLAIFLAVLIAVVARRPQLLVSVVVIVGAWFLVELLRARRNRR